MSVGVPAVVAGIELDKADASLHQSARQQATEAKLGGRGLIESVEVTRRFGFFGDIHGFGSMCLHAERQLVSGNARRKLGVGAALAQMYFVVLLHEFQRAPLLFGRYAGWHLQIQHRGRAAADNRPLIGCRQVAVAPGRRAALDPTAGVGEDNERGMFWFSVPRP